MTPEESRDKPAQGRIITFFSYKGGTGRSMALANVAWLLASAGKRVLMIDWDLEAPGLHRYVHPFLSDPELIESPGLIDFFLEFANAAVSTGKRSEEGWFRPYAATLNYIRSVEFPFPKIDGREGYLDLFPAGRQDEYYSLRVSGFNWERFYTAFGGGIFLEAVKQRLRKEYDYILIDSRTGVSDTSGICTVQMPDDLVACFTLNRQSIGGCAAASRSAFSQRRQRGEGGGLRVWPLPTRVEDAEKDKRDRMQDYAKRLFGGLIGHIPNQDRERYWGEAAVRYQPFYAYEEILSVFGDRPHATGSMLNSMEALTRHLTDGAVSELSSMSETVRRDGLDRYQAGLFPDTIGPTADGTEGAAIDVAIAESVSRSGMERFLDDAPLETALQASAAQNEPFTFYLSYANADRDPYLDRFLQDVRKELRIQVGNASIAFWDDSRELKSGEDFGSRISEASRKASAILALISPNYVHSHNCISEFRLFSSQARPALPVLWVPVDFNLLPEEIRRIQIRAGIEPYDELGLRRLGLLRRYQSPYTEMVAVLVDRMVAIARSGDEARVIGDPVRERVGSLAARYAKLRKTMPSGNPRTQLMEGIAAEMRELPVEAWKYLGELMNSDEPGERLAAIAMMQARPARAYVDWLATHVDPKLEKPFVAYHAAVALRVAANKLAPEDLNAVENGIVDALNMLRRAGGRADSDRDRTLNFALEEVRRRVPAFAMDYSKICYVIMPFGKKDIGGGRIVDFAPIYHDIFLPAIAAVRLPEGGTLQPLRADQDWLTGDIADKSQYLEYSRFVLADISGLNFNVAYELGVRHRAREAGTAIFREASSAPPFDISSIKAFPYEYTPAEEAAKSRELITRVLTESLLRSRLDSPVRLALNLQRQSGQIDELLKEAEKEIRASNWSVAINIYRAAVASNPTNPLPRMKLGLLCRDRGLLDEALEQFTAATVSSQFYGEAWREKGIVENKLAQIAKQPLNLNPAPGEASLRRAIEINSKDFEALASLGGILKRAGRFSEALAAYEKSLQVSDGHPYPLLNALKLRVQTGGHLALSGADKIALMRAARVRDGQSKQNPPFDKPWCFFDLAEIKLYQGDAKGFLAIAMQGFAQSDEDWQGKTFVDSLRLLLPAADELPGLKEGLAELEKLAG